MMLSPMRLTQSGIRNQVNIPEPLPGWSRLLNMPRPGFWLHTMEYFILILERKNNEEG